MPRLRDAPDDLFALSGAAAEELGIPDPAFVEKDFWAVELLRSVVKPIVLEPVGNEPASARVMFKGGTSLSKAYGLITRFSEDVDILVAISGYGVGAREKRVLRPICDRAQQDLELDDAAVNRVRSTTGVSCNVEYAYPVLVESSATKPGVLLEMGIRGGELPGTRSRSVRSYIAQYLDAAGEDAAFDELASVEVETLAPVRTLTEKLALLHHAGTLASSGDFNALSETGRHFYDVARLLEDPEVRAFLGAPDMGIAKISEDVDAHSAQFGWGFTPRPGDGYASSPAFSYGTTARSRQAAEESYAKGLRLVWGDPPTFEECLSTILQAAPLL